MCARPLPQRALPPPPRWRPLVLGGLLGAALAAGPTLVARGPAEEVLAWAVDRDGEALLGLGEGGLIRREIPALSPVFAAPRPDGGLWIVEALERSARGRHRLLGAELDGRRRELARFGRAGREPAPGEEPAYLGGATDGQGLWLLLGSGPGEEALWRVLPDLAPRRVLPLPGARLLARGPGGLLVAVGEDELVLLGPGPRPELRVRRRLGSPVVAIAPGPGGGWWGVTRSGSRPSPADEAAPATGLARRAGVRLLRLDRSLREAEAVTLPPGTWRFGASASAAWLLAPSPGRLVRKGPAPGEERSRDLPLQGLAAVWDGPGGETWLAGPGTVLALDRRGEPVWAQGGFERLVDLVPARIRAGR